jgi:N-acetylglucosamine kinase-like BadF-type ATPase
MAWYIGVDGGATSTAALLSDGVRVVARATAGPSNHQVVGLPQAAEAVAQVVAEVLTRAGLSADLVNQAVLGMAGADFPEDVAALGEALAVPLRGLAHRIVNDAEIALAAGLEAGPAGLVVLAGTGTNVLGRGLGGETFHIGGMGYPLGDLGGGADLVKMALHHAFRAAQDRGPATLLVDMILAALAVPNFEELARSLYFGKIDELTLGLLAPLVFRAAASGDRVSQDVLVEMGTKLGESAAAGVVRLRDWGVPDPVEVVLAGSLWFGPDPLMLDAFQLALDRRAAGARVHVTDVEPVVGALMMAVGDGERGRALRRQMVAGE